MGLFNQGVQSSVTIYPQSAKKGMFLNSRIGRNVVTGIVQEFVEVGRVVCKVFGIAKGICLPHANESVATFSGTMTAGHIAVTLQTLSGPTTISQAFATDLATTLAHLTTAIGQVIGVASAALVGDVLTINMAGTDGPQTADFSITGLTGGQTPDTLTVTAVRSFNMEIRGIAPSDEILVIDQNTGLVGYNPSNRLQNGSYGGPAIEILRIGSIAVYTETNITEDQAVYVRFINDPTDTTKVIGQIRADNASGLAVLWPNCKVVDGGSAGSIVGVELNLPNA